MFNRPRASDNPRENLAPPDSQELREKRWLDTIRKTDESFMMSMKRDTNQLVPSVQSRNASIAGTVDEYFSVRHAPGTANAATKMVRTPFATKKTLSEWIRLQVLNGTGNVAETKTYFERSASILHSLVLKMIVTNIQKGKSEMELAMDPKLITWDNVMIVEELVGEGETAHWLETECENPCFNKKYAAMKCLGMVAYRLLMRDSGPPIMAFLPSTITDSSGSPQLLLSLNDCEGGTDYLKRQKSTSSENRGRISTTMISAGVPYPLCRFVVDLLGGECSDGLLFRSDTSFDSFTDIIADLEQMRINPAAFIHLSVRDQWKLAFGEKMHGRDKEQRVLLDVASHVIGFVSNDALFEALAWCMPRNKQHIALITGQPGSGKSRLVKDTIKVLEKQGWSHLSCKFDRVVHSEPLSIVAFAFDEFLKQSLDERYNFRRLQITNSLKKLMQSEDIAVLMKHIPSLSKYTNDSHHLSTFTITKKEQINQLFSQLLQVLSAVGPLAFFVDDLQWADSASIDVFLALAKSSQPDFSSKSSKESKAAEVLLIGSYRDNEVHKNPELVEMLDQLRSTSTFEVKEISVRGFDISALNGIVSESLCLPCRRTKALTEIILQKTDGIIIHIIEFIGRLTMEKILCHSFVRGWEWDSEAIEDCPISESVAELFSFKLNSLQGQALMGVQICSIFGIRIDMTTIKLVQGYDGDDSTDIVAGIEAATELGLVEKDGENTFKFAHDIIVQAAFDLIPIDERSLLLKKLATTLIKNATAADQLELVIFVLVDIINRIKNSDITDPDERVLYATMNDKAARRALSVPDFNSAVKYTESAISYLDHNHWESHNELVMSVYKTSVVALYSCVNGNQDVLKERIDAVLDNSSSPSEEFETRYIWIMMLSKASLEDAIKECHRFIERLGETIDPNDISPTFAASELVRVKESFLEANPDISSLSQMVNTNKLQAMKIMASLSILYHWQRSYMNVIVVTRMVELSMKNGCSPESPFAFASFSGMVSCNLGDMDQGCIWARRALSLVERKFRQSSNIILPAVYAAVYGYSLVWSEPFQSTIEGITQGCLLGFTYGDIEFGAANATVYSARSFCSGRNIDILVKEMESLARKCSEHGQMDTIQFYLTPVYNIIHSLKGLDERVLAPLTTYTSNEQLLELSKKGSHRYHLGTLVLLEIMGHVILRRMDKAKLILDMCRSSVPEKRWVFYQVMTDFFLGLTACYLARQSEQDDTQMVEVQVICDKLDRLRAHSKWNFENKFLLLKAEYHFSKGEVTDAAKYYHDSIDSANKHKFIHEEAIGCELAGYFYKEQGDETASAAMFLRAHSAYSKWGAVHKANTLPLGEDASQKSEKYDIVAS